MNMGTGGVAPSIVTVIESSFASQQNCQCVNSLQTVFLVSYKFVHWHVTISLLPVAMAQSGGHCGLR